MAAGWLAATAVGLAAGVTAGELVGTLVGTGEPEEHANVYSESVRRGGTLVTARLTDEEASRIQTVLDGYKPINLAARGVDYRCEG